MPLTGALLRYLRKNEFSWGGVKPYLARVSSFLFCLDLKIKIKSWYKCNGSH